RRLRCARRAVVRERRRDRARPARRVLHVERRALARRDVRRRAHRGRRRACSRRRRLGLRVSWRVHVQPPGRGGARAGGAGRRARSCGCPVPHDAAAVLPRRLLMSFDVRTVKDLDEFTSALLAIGQYFGMTPTEERMQRSLDLIGGGAIHAAWENGPTGGGAGAFAFGPSVRGGALRTAGVTVVGVYPTHRRRGVLRSLMRAQLDAAHERGEPIAALWASEETIYGRYGYGLASFCGEIKLAHEYTSFALPFEPEGTIRFLDPDEAREVVPAVYERVRALWPGMFSRDDLWWEQRELNDPEDRREGAGPKRWVAYERDGAVDAYAAYRHKPGWDEGSTLAELRVVEALAATPTAERDLWGYLLSIDWKATVQASLLPPDHALFLLLATPRRLRYRMGDGLWVRLVDVGTALSG